jgi:hypothetical protein
MMDNIFGPISDYDESVENAIKGDTSGGYQKVCLDLLKGDRDQGSKVDNDQAKRDAQNIHQVCGSSHLEYLNHFYMFNARIQGGSETKSAIAAREECLRNVLCKANPQQAQETLKQYKEVGRDSPAHCLNYNRFGATDFRQTTVK